MSQAFGELGHLHEDDYFHRQEQEALERQHRRSAQDAAAASLMATLGITDAAVADELAGAGFTPETARLLFVVPAVQVAWSDGEASAKEKAQVLDIAAHLGAPSGSGAHARLEGWLRESPPEGFFQIAINGIKAVLANRPPAEAEALRTEVLGNCRRVAEASGGFLGMAKVSEEEEHIRQKLTAEHS